MLSPTYHAYCRLQGVNPGQAQARVVRETLSHTGDAGSGSDVAESVLLLDLLYAQPDSHLSALADYLVQLDNLSHVLAWTKSTRVSSGASVVYA